MREEYEEQEEEEEEFEPDLEPKLPPATAEEHAQGPLLKWNPSWGERRREPRGASPR